MMSASPRCRFQIMGGKALSLLSHLPRADVESTQLSSQRSYQDNFTRQDGSDPGVSGSYVQGKALIPAHLLTKVCTMIQYLGRQGGTAMIIIGTSYLRCRGMYRG